MSIQVMTTVWKESKQKGSSLLLLLALADHAADDGFCWPGTELLAQKIRMSTRSVYRKIQEIEEAGELTVVRGQHNWYVVRLGMTDAQVADVLAARGFVLGGPEQPLPDNLSRDKVMSLSSDNSVTSEVTEQCHPNLHEPSSNRQEEPPTADSPPADDVAETEALFNKTKPSEPRTAEQHKAGIQRALEKFDRTGGNAGVADPTHEGDPWMGRPVQEWCVFIRLPYEQLTDGRKAYFATELSRIAVEVRASADQTSDAIRKMTRNPGCQWMRTASSPKHSEFAGVLLNVLMGQALPEGNGRKGGPSTPREQPISADTVVVG